MTTIGILLFPSMNMVLNSEHIISAQYHPAYDTTDDNTGEPVTMKSTLVITTTGIVPYFETNYDGDVKHVCSVSDTITLKGEEADSIWEMMNGDAA